MWKTLILKTSSLLRRTKVSLQRRIGRTFFKKAAGTWFKQELIVVYGKYYRGKGRKAHVVAVWVELSQFEAEVLGFF